LSSFPSFNPSNNQQVQTETYGDEYEEDNQDDSGEMEKLITDDSI